MENEEIRRSDEYNVKLDLFEGPLDLLLYVVNKSEVDIVNISVAAVTKQYLNYLDIMRDLNINIASEYLSMAATLIRLKAHEILPPEEDEQLGDEEDVIINRAQLIEKLLEYKKYKEAAGSLQDYESENIGTFKRGKKEDVEVLASTEEEIASVSMFDLMTAFQRVMERLAESDDVLARHVIQSENVRLDDRLEHVLGLVTDGGEILFDDLFRDDTRKVVLVVTFMAILELVKMKQIIFRQEELLGNIYVKKRTDFSDVDVEDMKSHSVEEEGTEE